MPTYEETYRLYAEVYKELQKAFPSASLNHDEYYTQPHYHTATPRTTVRVDNHYLGYILCDKYQAGWTWYLSFFTDIRNHSGFYGPPQITEVISVFQLMHQIRAKTICKEDALAIGTELKIEPRSIAYFFK